MADKGKRIASRQAQLKRRKRRGKGRSQHFDAGPIEGAAASPEATAPEAPGATAPDPAAQASAAQPTPDTQPAPARPAAAARTARRTRAAARAEASVIYPYLGVELRHIGVLAALLAVALVVLTLLFR